MKHLCYYNPDRIKYLYVGKAKIDICYIDNTHFKVYVIIYCLKRLSPNQILY